MHSRRLFPSPAVPGHVRALLRDTGRPLDAPTRHAMEQRFGADLDAVRHYQQAARSEEGFAAYLRNEVFATEVPA